MKMKRKRVDWCAVGLILAGCFLATPLQAQTSAPLGQVVLDVRRSRVYSLTTAGQPNRYAIEARRLRDGRRLWTSEPNLVPVALLEGRLLAARVGSSGPPLVLLDRAGHEAIDCGSSGGPWQYGGRLGSAGTIQAQVVGDALYITQRVSHRYAGGAAPTPEQMRAARHMSTQSVRVSFANGRCTAETVDEIAEVPAPITVSSTTTDGQLTVTVQSGDSSETVYQGPGTLAFLTEDQAHIAVVNRTPATPTTLGLHALTIVNLQGRRVGRWITDLVGQPSQVFVHRTLVALVANRGTFFYIRGRLAFAPSPPVNTAYNGPRPPRAAPIRPL